METYKPIVTVTPISTIFLMVIVCQSGKHRDEQESLEPCLIDKPISDYSKAPSADTNIVNKNSINKIISQNL